MGPCAHTGYDSTTTHATNTYETPQASHGLPAQQRGPQCHLYQRHPPHSMIGGGATRQHSHDSQPTRVTGLLSQLPEVTLSASSEHRLLGLLGGLHTFPQPAEGCSDTSRSSESSGP